ncbi:MAG TPA: thioredoxin domain-containing protein [Chloroflexota bacterium]|nr:thioredoxin domain-containing protein [Chloroflexota bacterium]
MANRLAGESSPYLLQHKDNPVDWYPWGPEALARARSEDKPILLSIGYSACHWCHVMEHESFENRQTAALMNDHFVSIKVDREERPDIDTIYMAAVQRLTGQGGWPMTMFLTPEGRPFYGGTYFPPVPRHGMPSFPQLLAAVSETYEKRRQDVERTAADIAAALAEHIHGSESLALSEDLLALAARNLGNEYDSAEGGFGGAPKFPQPMALEFLLRAHLRGVPRALAMVERTLEKMAAGGIHDQLGGGFHRYSVDGMWLVPHFEKMLYDNAQLARIYLLAYQATGKPLYRRVAEGTLRYVQREMTSPEGAFYASQDADSEGEEGKFFVWTSTEIEEALGADAPLFMRAYGVTKGGNFEGNTILHLPRDPLSLAREEGLEEHALGETLARCKAILFAIREQRVRPARDEKTLTAWNGLMLRAFATAAAILDEPAYRATAEANADFLLKVMRKDGRLLRTYKDGVARLNGYLEDYAFLADGLVALYEATGDRRRLDDARALADAILLHFTDPAGGPFFSTSDDHEQLIQRPRDLTDNAIPAGNSVAAEVLLRLAAHTGDERYRLAALGAIAPLEEAMARVPLAFARILRAADFALDPPRELAIIGDRAGSDTRALLTVAHRRFDPNLVIAVASPAEAAASDSPLLRDRPPREGKATAYYCESYTCQAPVTEPEALARLLA